jgi:YcaO-like protein with predicted kinase domain
MRKAGYERMKKINRHWFGEAGKIIDLENMKNRSSTSFKEDIETTIDQVNKCSLDQILFVDLTRESVGVPVVRVIVPGLEVFSVDPDRIGERLTKIKL